MDSVDIWCQQMISNQKKSLENAILTMFSPICKTFVLICFVTSCFIKWLLLCVSLRNLKSLCLMNMSSQKREKRSVLLPRDIPYNLKSRQRRAGLMPGIFLEA